MCLIPLSCVQAPRSEALTILGSLVCFPNTYREIPLRQPVPEVAEVATGAEDVKVRDAVTESQVSVFSLELCGSVVPSSTIKLLLLIPESFVSPLYVSIVVFFFRILVLWD